MILRTLSYQQRVLGLLDTYLDALAKQKARASKIEQANAQITDEDLKHEPLNFPQKTWEEIKGHLPPARISKPYSARLDATGRHVPNIVYKVPTAGGKTFLAVASLSKIFGAYLNKSTGFVLWVVPNEAIYTQTKKHLNDRRHPYRQMLDNAAGSAKAVKIIEKTTPLKSADIEQSFCVMLLMLQSSNRQNQATLKMFKERGDVKGFTPEEGDQIAHKKMIKEIPNLDLYKLTESPYPWMPICESLGNALRVIRPVVVVDEGHKAVSDLAFETLYGFNPSFVLELTATPKDAPAKGDNPARYQNILAEVSGQELDQESMIKMPIELDSRQSKEWKSTLRTALDRLNILTQKAKNFQADRNRYIRPIMLVQVERTGDDQRGGKYIHAEDVREWLLIHGGLQDNEIAIKTAQKNDLKMPENQNLLAEINPIRVIITKQALQEGWDCPFAYVLCALAASQNLTAMTQLIGRILRQPYAEKTGVSELDRCYIITHHAKTDDIVNAIKEGLKKEGMENLNSPITTTAKEKNTDPHAMREIPRRPEFSNLSIFLPKVLCVANNEQRPLNYETDILCQLDWRNLNVSKMVNIFSAEPKIEERKQHRINLDTITKNYIDSPPENRTFDSVHIARYISDIVPNAWIAWDIVDRVRQELLKSKLKQEDLDKFSPLIEIQLRSWLEEERDIKAEKLFRNEVNQNRIQFRLRADANNWEMPLTIKTSHPNIRSEEMSTQLNLFQPVYRADFNEQERLVAFYMDDEETMNWWHRNAARHHYHIQGWRRGKIYPDFICSVRKDKGNKFVILETKGEQLAGNDDSEYKRKVLELMKDSFAFEENVVTPVGEMELLIKDGTSVVCAMVMMKDYKAQLPKIFHE